MDPYNYLQEAQEAVARVRRIVKISSAILDDWRGMRIIYGYSCSGVCSSCALYRAVGKDTEEFDDMKLRTTLRKATVEDRVIFSPQCFLNCKTPEQYVECFVQWLVTKCFTYQEVRDELSLVQGFRLLYQEGTRDLRASEENLKRLVVEHTLAHIHESDQRHAWVREIALSLKLRSCE